MIIGFFLTFWLTYRVCKFVFNVWKTGFLAGYRPLFDPTTVPGSVITTCWWNPGFLWPWKWRRTAYFNHEYEVITVIPWLTGGACYLVGSVAAARQILGGEAKTQLIKPLEFTTAGLWGDSIASVSGEDWKRHRRIIAPSFNVSMFSLVVGECRALYNEMMETEEWRTGPASFVHINHLVTRFTFVILSRCGFGIPAAWKKDGDSSEQACFVSALATASKTFLIRVVTPHWAYWLPNTSLREVDSSWNTVMSLMSKFAEARKADLANEVDDLRARDAFTRLVLASDDKGKHALNTQEVTANMLSLLFAGHETTASALVTTLTMLALHQDEQIKVFQEIVQEFPVGCTLTTDVIKGLKYVSACIQEAHRLIPAIVYLARDVTQDIEISLTRPYPTTLTIRKGSRILIDQLSILHNPVDYPEPDKFIPSRWLDVPEQDVPMFGFGPRSCLGRTFAITEMTGFIALFLRDWKVDVELGDGDTRERYQERLMQNASLRGTAFTLGEVFLKVTPRT